MRDDREGGIALITGAIGGLITMGIHPTARDLFTPERIEAMARLSIAAHALAIACVPLSFFGALILTRRLGGKDRASGVLALIVYGLAAFSITVAAAASGFLATNVIARITNSTPTQSDLWRVLLTYTGFVNQAFARISAVAWGTAILLWSIAVLRSRRLSRGIGIYGVILGPVMIVAIGSGHVRLDVHGFAACCACPG